MQQLCLRQLDARGAIRRMLLIAQEGAESIKRWSLHQTRTSGFRNLRQRCLSGGHAAARACHGACVCHAATHDRRDGFWLRGDNGAPRACHGQTSRAGVRVLTTCRPVWPRTAPPARVRVGSSLTRQLSGRAPGNDNAPSITMGRLALATRDYFPITAQNFRRGHRSSTFNGSDSRACSSC